MAPTQVFQRALKQKHYIKIIELAIKSDNNRQYLLNLHDDTFWKQLSTECYGRIDFIHMFRNKLDWKIVSKCPLTITAAYKFKNYLLWSLVSEQKFLSQNFILLFGDLLNMQTISKNYNNLSLEVQQKYAEKLNWKCVVISHTLLKEWFKEPISYYIDYEQVSKCKHLGVLVNFPYYMEKINLDVYMQNRSKISNALLLYCLREGRVNELKKIAGTLEWSDYMLIFDQFPGLVDTLCADWKCIKKWNAFNAPPAYYIRHMFKVPKFRNDFEQDFVNKNYWERLHNYTITTKIQQSIVFNLMLFQNYKLRADWSMLQQCDQLQNLAILYRMPTPNVDVKRVDDEKLWTAYGMHLKQVSHENDEKHENVIPLHMSVKDAYEKMILVEPCATQHEHETAETCKKIFTLNGGEEGLLNWNLMSSTQPVCPFNLRHLQNVNANTYRKRNKYYTDSVYEKIIMVQMNI